MKLSKLINLLLGKRVSQEENRRMNVVPVYVVARNQRYGQRQR